MTDERLTNCLPSSAGRGGDEAGRDGTTFADERDKGAGTSRLCPKCGTPASGDDDHCQAKGCGSFLPANSAALIHGGRRFVDGRSPMDESERVAVRDAVLSDLGGCGEVSEALRALVDDFSFAVVLTRLLSAHLAAVGPLTKRGRRRAAVDTWYRASARLERLAARIGTERRGAPVPSLDEFLRERVGDGRNGDAGGR